jgi:hypothetical protein
MRWAWYVASMGEKRNTYSVLLQKAEEKRLRHRWTNNIHMDHKEIGWDRVD